MSIITESAPIPDSVKRTLVRRDSKDSCFSEEMSEDLSVTVVDESNRLSPPMTTLSPISRKSSGGDSGIDYDASISEGELSRENSFKKTIASKPAQSTSSSGYNSDLVMDKLSSLEQKLKDMEAQLRQEMEKRITLEKKVTVLEEENEKLATLRTKAASQIQHFSEKFFALPDPVKSSSPIGTPPLSASPINSRTDLRRVGSNSSVQSRLSLQSMQSLKSRYSNISL